MQAKYRISSTHTEFNSCDERTAIFLDFGAFGMFSSLSYRCLFVSATLITRSAPKDKLFAAHEKLMRNPECCPVVVLVFIVFQSVHKLARSRRPFLHSVLMQIFYAKYTLLLHFLFNLIPHV